MSSPVVANSSQEVQSCSQGLKPLYTDHALSIPSQSSLDINSTDLDSWEF